MSLQSLQKQLNKIAETKNEIKKKKEIKENNGIQHEIHNECQQRIEEFTEVEKQKDDKMQQLEDEVKKYQENLSDSNVKKDLQALNDENEYLKKINQTLNDDNELLKKRNKNLNDENAELQNYVGKATTYSLNDDDSNHSTQLVKDIENLLMKIEKY